jgi:hypothetical protein
MIEQISGLPENIVGFKATGKVSKEEYDTILIPAVDKLANDTVKIRYLFVLDTDISNMSAGAWYDDLKVGLKHLLYWKKIAIVSDQPGVNKITDISSFVLPGEVKSFTIKELVIAKQWLSE